MSITVDTVNLRFNIKPQYDQQQLNELKDDLKAAEKEFKVTAKEVEQSAREYKKLNEQLKNMKDNRDRLAAQKSRTPEEEQQLQRLNKRIAEHIIKVQEQDRKHGDLLRRYREQTLAIQNAQKKLDGYTKEIGLNKLSINELTQKQRELNTIVRQLKPGTKDFEEYTSELKAVTEQLAKTKEEIYGVKESLENPPNNPSKWSKFIEGINQLFWFIEFLYKGIDKIVSWADQYVQAFAKMDDAMTDVMKYTGQTKAEVEEMNETFKKITTRTPREELNALAGAAGRLGIQGKENIVGFVDAADKINVALGDDLGEGAIDQIGKLTMVFGEDKTKGLNGAMLATGSAINVLGANSSANTGFITEFTSDMAGMAVNAKIAQTDIMGYASALSQAGVEGKTASGVFAQLITKMFTDPAKFAKAAKLDVKAFTDLLKTDANTAILQFLEGLKQNGGFDALAPALKSLKMQGTQAVPVISSLINKMDELKKAQNDARKAYDEGTSIIEEFNNANSSAAAKLEIAKKEMNDAAADLGKKLMPIVETSINSGAAAIKIISSLISFTIQHRTQLIILATTIAALTVAWQAHVVWQKIVAAWNTTLVAGNKAVAASMWLLRSAGVALQATWALLNKGVQGYIVVMRAARLASLTNPWTALATALTVVGVAIYGVTKAWKAHAQALREQDPAYRAVKAHTKDMQDINKRMNNETAKEMSTIHQLTNIIRSNAFSINERRAAIKKLQKIVPEYHADIDKEGKLIESNTDKLKDYITNLQKAARAQAYMDKLAEIENEKLDNDLLLSRKKNNLKLVDAELNRGKNTIYKSQKEFKVTNVGTATANAYSGGTVTAIETNEKLTAKLKERQHQQEAVNAALKTQEELTRRQQALMNQMKKDGIVQEFVVSGNKPTDTAPNSSGGSGGSGGLSDKEQSARDRQRKELEAQAKAAWEREKIELRQQYQGKKQLQDEWHQKEFSAEQSYIARLLEIRKDYGAKESEIMEAVNMKLDADAKEATYREEQRKRKQQESLRNIDQMQAAGEVALAQQQLNGEVKTQEEFNQKKLELEIKFQEMRKNALTAGSAEYLAAQRQLLVLELQQQQQKQKEQEQFTSSYQSTNNGILHQHFSQADSFDEMLRLNDEYRNKDLISEQQYQQNKTDILRVATDERQAIQQSAYDAVNDLMASASQLFSAMQQRETQAVDAKYKKLIASAKKQGKDTTKLEEQQQAEKEAIQKRYAEKQFMMQVLQIVASTATGIARLFADLPFYAALPLTAVVAASGAMQLAAAQAAADQASGLYGGGYSDEYQEGYTDKGNPREQAGVIPVHKNEFVANHKAVANPQVRPVLDVIDRHQKIGDIQMLDATRMLEEAYGRGRYRGGYTQGDDRDIPEGDEAMDPQANSAEMITILRHIEANTADAMTVREVRDQIRRLERLEANARR